METQPGAVNWGALNRSLDPSETRLMAWQAVARGADAVLYWQWRSALGGQEQYHGVLVGPDGRPTPVYDEVARTAREFALAAPHVHGTRPRAEAALIYDQDSRWALEQQRHAKDYDPVAVMKAWHRPFFDRNIDVDVVYPGQACSYMLGQLKLVELRERTREALGDRFSIREYHDVVLGLGVVPLVILEEEVDAYIASQAER